MIDGDSVLAIVPARSGSKGIPGKNMRSVGGLSLIARAGDVLSSIAWIDRRVISTDSASYAEEGRAHGLDAPFLRPETLSHDHAGALETVVHALETCERLDRRIYNLIVLTEPTSPLRRPEDVEATVRSMLESGADSAMTVSVVDTKYHPEKVFRIVNGVVRFYAPAGGGVTRRQQLESLYSRNGLCYCFRRETLMTKGSLITENTIPVITTRAVVNIDEPLDLLWAEFLLKRNLALDQTEEGSGD
jgi:CMP-N,N'-diacetyllegionaminic acid synthase